MARRRGGRLPARLRPRERRRGLLRLDHLPVPREAGRRADREGARPASRRATADHAGSLRAGTTALRAALDAVAAGSARARARGRERLPARRARLALERSFGDGAVAFLVGDARRDRELRGAFAVADELVDVWRSRAIASCTPGRSASSSRRATRRTWSRRCAACSRSRRAAPATSRASRSTRPTSAAHAASRARCGSRPRAGAGRRCSAGSATPAPRSRRCCSLPRSRRRGPASACSSRATATARRRSRCAPPQIEKLEPRRGVSWHLARRPAGAELRPLSARARPRDARVGGRRRSGPLRDDPLPRARRGRLASWASAARAAARAVPEPARLRDLLREGRVGARAALGPRSASVVTYTFDFFFPTPEPPTIVTMTEIDGARVHVQLVEHAPQKTKHRAAGRVRVPPDPRGRRPAELLLEGERRRPARRA